MKPADPVLIAYLPTPRDLELARTKRWYRVPVKHAPRALAQATALAFYQGTSFGEQRWRIEYWAPIERCVETTRLALVPDEPDHPRADDPYVKVVLGAIQPLPQPLTSDQGRRLLFKSTVWGRLIRSTSLDELYEKRPIGDDPLYQIVKSQVDTAASEPDTDRPRQRRLFEGEE